MISQTLMIRVSKNKPRKINNSKGFLEVLEPDNQHLHQYDWSSGQKKSKDEGLAISSMNFNFDGKGGKKIRDSELSEDSAGDDDVPALMYDTIAEGLC